MRRLHLSFLLLPLLPLTPACEADNDALDSELRDAAPVEPLPIDTGVELSTTSGDNDGSVIWEIVEAVWSSTAVEVHEVNSGDDKPLITIENGVVYGTDGAPTCYFAAVEPRAGVFQLRSVTGDVIYTSDGMNVLDGGLVPPAQSSGAIAYSFHEHTVLVGGESGSPVLKSSANAHTTAGPYRLLVSALLDSECLRSPR